MAAEKIKLYDVFIYDDEAGFTQPMRCKATSEHEARRLGERYINAWSLRGGMIVRIECVA